MTLKTNDKKGSKIPRFKISKDEDLYDNLDLVFSTYSKFKDDKNYGMQDNMAEAFDKEFDNIIENKIIPYEYSSYIYSFNSLLMRDKYTSNISWCLVSESWVNELVKVLKGKKCLELYAGRGLLSYCLQSRGVSVKPCDDYSWIGSLANTFTSVENMDAVDFIRKNKDEDIDYIIISWPPYEDHKIEEVTKEIKKYFPKCTIVYIGEDWGGCNATNEWFDMLSYDYLYIKSEEKINDHFQQWYGIHDKVRFFKIK